MSLTPNYGFNIPTGTDTVNLLTQCYPNFSALDGYLKTVADTGVTVATATKVGTVFQLVRTNSDLMVIRFVATGNYNAGDTFTVDGVAVTATAVDGTSLQSGSFVINQSVLAILNGSVLTVYAGGASAPNASDVSYDNSGSGLTATNVQDAIDEVKSDIPTVPATYAATAVTYDNSGSGLTATDAQAAIDEVNGKINGETCTALLTDAVAGTYSITDISTFKEFIVGITATSNPGVLFVPTKLPVSVISTYPKINVRSYIGNDIYVQIEFTTNTSVVVLQSNAAFKCTLIGVK